MLSSVYKGTLTDTKPDSDLRGEIMGIVSGNTLPVYVAGTDKTFSLCRRRRHPTCIENLPSE